MKILITECDVPIDELKQEYGDYKTYFATLLQASAAASNSQAELSFDALSAYRNIDMPDTATLRSYDGIVISGSRHNSYDDDEWILKTLETIKQAYHAGIPMAGICFGHQLIARALGGKVGVNPAGWEIAVTSTTFSKEIPLFPNMKTMRLQQMHRDYVSEAPPIEGCQVFLANANCSIQGMYCKDKFLTVQGHPEFNRKTVETLVQSRVKLGIVPEEYGRDAFSRAKDDHDGLIVGQAILEFFNTTS